MKSCFKLLSLFMLLIFFNGCVANMVQQPPMTIRSEYTYLTKTTVTNPYVIAIGDIVGVAVASSAWIGEYSFKFYDDITMKEIQQEKLPEYWSQAQAGNNFHGCYTKYENNMTTVRGQHDFFATIDDYVSSADRTDDYIFATKKKDGRLSLMQYDLNGKNGKEIMHINVKKLSNTGTVLWALGIVSAQQQYASGNVVCMDNKVYFATDTWWEKLGSNQETFNDEHKLYVFDVDGHDAASIGGKTSYYLGKCGTEIISGGCILNTKTLKKQPLENGEYLFGYSARHIFYRDNDGSIYYKEM
ncbi:hypothetical protein [Maridesulfovibrio bastinii]|uniref:hypothetical protein n=1 Tax=Maridesulfovibrio bastinii TaxID=47157 RepID=UPI000429AB49|nr:hypothetical protein [Maridesulfovibrio bastinii]